MSDSPRPSFPLGTGDLLALLLAAFAIAFGLAFPFTIVPRFSAMYRDFGDAALPALTRLVLTPWLTPLLALLPASGLVLAFRRRTLQARTWWLGGGVLLGCVTVAAIVWALYLPILGVADAIR